MKAAYEILGYPTYHYVSMMETPPDIDFWLSLLSKKYPLPSSPPSTTETQPQPQSPTLTDWDALLGHVSAVTDSPSNAFAADLISAYPAAKVILVEREVESWYTSFEKNVISSFSAPLTRLICFLDPGFVGKQGQIGSYIMRGQWCASSFSSWRKNARDKYLQHNQMIKERVPKERLLVYKLGSGWEPLCEFLGKEVPKDIQFPRVNETEELKERVFLALMLGVRRAGVRYTKVLGLVVVPLVAVVWWVWRGGV
jgi:hypothetical protein